MKRSPPPSFGLGDSSPPGGASINWRLSFGNVNSSHVSIAPPAPRPSKQHFRNRASWRPEVRIIGDNLAVNLSWPSRNSQQRQISHYRIQFRYRDPHERHWDRPIVVVQTRLSGRVREPYMYVTNKQPGGLEAGKVYQFQVVAVFVNAETPEEKSRWSATTSFDYISPEPPLVRVARRLPDGAVHIKWSRPWRQNDFRITRFIILFRKEKRLPGGETAFHGFHHITALGTLEEYKVTQLDQRAGYQFVVYGENTPEGVDPSKTLFTGGLNGRKITTFSQEVFVPMAVLASTTKEHDGGIGGGGGNMGSLSTFNHPSLLDMNASSSNSLMFLILGVLAGAMLIVMTSLVAICFFRQRKEKLRLLAQVNDKAHDQCQVKRCDSRRDSCGVTSAQFDEPPSLRRIVRFCNLMLRQCWGNVFSDFLKAFINNQMDEEAATLSALILCLHLCSDIRMVAGSPAAGERGIQLTRAGSSGAESVGSKLVASKSGTGFLLSELTPIAVANFRTASPQLISVAGERESLITPTPLPFPACESRPRGSPTTAPGEFNVPVMEMKREPPSGGSIHEESDGELVFPFVDDTSKSAKDTARPSTTPSTHRNVLFTQIPFHSRGYPLRDSHLHRRPPSPALGLGFEFQRPSQNYSYDHGQGKEFDGWGVPVEARGTRLGRLGSRSFAYPNPTTNAGDWLPGRHSPITSTHFLNLTSRGLFPPPQRIQAIVQQSDRNKEEVGVVKEMKISGNLRGPVEASRSHGPKALPCWTQVMSPLERSYVPRRRGFLGLRSHIHSLAVTPSTNNVSEQPEQADAYTQTLANTDGNNSGVGATSHGNDQCASSSPANGSPREMGVNFFFPSASPAVTVLPTAGSRTDTISHRV
ncbi:unnamed protein product [Hydatigera taeniaeformis]|uniref:Fibronectin type-III domain-containing protein n=1 Tax=Hydatigena taeniaeformis TaxID=6205 RepID=A0A3P7EIY7_HYDTA|nr:unnamed protein product [Hydatigera taeniaeformis]